MLREWSAAKEKEKKTNQRERTRCIPERWQGGGGVRERGEGKDALQSVARKGWGGVLSQKKGEGEAGEGNWGARSGACEARLCEARLGEFPRVTKGNRGNIPKQCHICHVTHCTRLYHVTLPSFFFGVE